MSTHDQVVQMSRTIGEPALDAVILGEGNTSIRVDGDTFLVKGSGCQLASITQEDFVHLRFDRILALLDRGAVSEAELVAAYESAKVDPAQKRRPSVETLFHAICLSLPGVDAIAHTHPQAVNALTCSTAYPSALEGRMFPDEAVVLGPASVFVPYLDPGLTLARAIHTGVMEYGQRYGAAPKVVYMQNHGVIALGKNTTEAINITMMAIKAARIRLGALTAGGIRTLPESVIEHLINRPDEKYRAKLIATGAGGAGSTGGSR
ncbi:MAG: class II aldolase/adducin family protein [Planctomycetes bacterium]|nr:class II aldolase/adducin family protein [Planctomycetota bacterium]